MLFVRIQAYDDFDFDSLKEKQFARRRMRKSNNDPHLRFNKIAANSHAMCAKILKCLQLQNENIEKSTRRGKQRKSETIINPVE
jgi:hypothetical protein